MLFSWGHRPRGRHTLRRHRGGVRRSTAVLAVTALAVTGLSAPAGSAPANPSSPSDPAGASASWIELTSGAVRLAGAGWSSASSEANPGPNRSHLDADAAGRNLVLLDGVKVPLADFIDFGQAGALYSESEATSPTAARGISGALSADGALTLDRANGGFTPVDIDLLALFRKAGVSGLTNLLVDQARLRLGIGGAEVRAENGVFVDLDGVGGPGRYRVAQADLDLGSPVVKAAAGALYDAAGRMDRAAEDRLNQLLDTSTLGGSLPDGTTLSAHVSSALQEKVVAAILARPVTTKNHVLTVDFSTGTATIHLDQALHGQETEDGPLLPPQDVRPGDPTGLNSQDPDTELINDELYPMVAESVHDLMNEVTAIALGAVENALDSITVDFTATRAGATATWTANLGSNQLAPVQCMPAGGACDQLAAAVEATRPAYDEVFAPLRDLLVGDQGDQLFRLAVDDVKTGLITIPVRNALKPVIDLAAKVLSVQVNHQTSRSCTTPDGGSGVDRLSVSAFSIALVPALNLGRLSLGNASARVEACAPAARASVLDANSGTVPVAGLGYSEAWPGTSPGPNRAGPNPSVLGQQYVLLGGVEVPVEDFVEYGDLAGIQSESTATSPTDARAVTGAVGPDGSISLDNTPASGTGPARIDLLALLRRGGIDGLTDLAIDRATLDLGALGAEVQAEAGRILDPDGVGGPGRYRVGQADLELHSPAVEQASAMIYDAIGLMDQAAENTLNKVLDLTALTKALPYGTSLTAHITSRMQEDVFAAILARPVTTKNHVLTVDFSTGTATIHLDQALHGQETEDGPLLPPQDVRPGDPTGLNSQDPDTELINDELYPMVAESVHDLMNEVTAIALGAVENALGAITIDLGAKLAVSPTDSATVAWSLNLMGDQLNPATCTPTGLTGRVLCGTLMLAVNLLKPVVNKLVVPARNLLLGDAGDQLFRLAVDDVKTGLITIPLRKAVKPFLDLAAMGVSVQVNHQETGTCRNPDGSTRLGALQVSAVSIAVLRRANGAQLNLGNAGVRTPC